MIAIFRGLILASTAMFIASFYVGHLGPPFVPEQFLDLRQWDGLGAILSGGPELHAVVFVSGTAIPVLLFFFTPWSRAAFLILTVALAILSLGWGIRIISPLESLMSQVVAIADGAILAIAYFSSVSLKFKRDLKE